MLCNAGKDADDYYALPNPSGDERRYSAFAFNCSTRLPADHDTLALEGELSGLVVTLPEEEEAESETSPRRPARGLPLRPAGQLRERRAAAAVIPGAQRRLLERSALWWLY